MDNDFSRQLLNHKMNAIQQQNTPSPNLHQSSNIIKKKNNGSDSDNIVDKILNDNIDKDDNVSMSAQAILNEYREYVKNFFTIKTEIKALQHAMKTRRKKIKILEEKIKNFMIENEIEILNTQFGFLSTETKDRKKQANNKQNILEKARQELTPNEFEKLKKIYKEEIYVKTNTLKIISK